MKEKDAVVIDHYIIINENETLNLKNKKGKVVEEIDDRIKIKIENKVYDLPKDVVIQIIK
jgi:hypothetical protein